MIDKWLHIEELRGDPWILPIWNSVNEAVEKGKIGILPNKVYESGLHISFRLNILPRIVKRINTEVEELYSIAEKHEDRYVFTKNKNGYGLRVDNDLKYSLLCDIDSLLFEIQSVCELMTKLFKSLYAHTDQVIDDKKIGLKIKSIIDGTGQDSSWFSELAGHRNLFIHEAAPYIAIDISGGSGHYELLIMKENLKSFEDNDKFVTMSELNGVVQGFINSKPIIQSDLINLFKKL